MHKKGQMTTGQSVEKQEFLTERAYALSSYALSYVALTRTGIAAVAAAAAAAAHTEAVRAGGKSSDDAN